MKLKFKIRHIVLAAANAAALVSMFVMTAVGGTMAKSQEYNYAASEWGGKKGNYTQMSCFFSDDAGFSTDSVNGVRSTMLGELQTVSVVPEEGRTLVPDAWSASLGNCQAISDTNSRTETEVTAVGGDFFLFRDFKLLDGVYFTKDDLMQDGAVIDRNLAWALYGSDKISGMNMYINGVQFYIAGVIDLPGTKPEKECAGKTPRAYISYDMAYSVSAGTSQKSMTGRTLAGDMVTDVDMPGVQIPEKFTKITCYECIIPSPVDSFASNTVKKIFGDQYKGKISIVNNTGRFAPKKRAKAYKKLSSSVVRKDGIVYPYWENASRIVEYKLTRLYHVRKMIMFIPVLTLMWIGFRLFCFWRRKKPKVKKYIERKLDRDWHKFRGLFRRRKNQEEL